jgi:hypothetical protein
LHRPAMGFAIAREDGRKRPYELNPSYKESKPLGQETQQARGQEA